MEKLGFCNYRRKRGGKRTKQVTNQVLNKSFSEVEKNNLKVQYLNARSIRNKSETIFNEVLDHKLDILILTETWLMDTELIELSLAASHQQDTCLPIYPDQVEEVAEEELRSSTGTSSRWSSSSQKNRNLEYIELLMTTRDSCVRIVPVYQSPSTLQSLFLKEFKTFLDSTTTKLGKPLVICDFNIIIYMIFQVYNIRYYSWFTKAYMVKVQPTWHQCWRTTAQFAPFFPQLSFV